MTDTSVLEIVIFQLQADEPARQARSKAMEALKTYPGFRSWRAMVAHDRPGMAADLVEWDSMEAAQTAAGKVRVDPAFAPYMNAISSVKLMQHFHTIDTI